MAVGSSRQPFSSEPPPAAALESSPGECPVVRLADGTWAVRGHADVLAVATAPETFSSAARRHLHVPNGMDGEEHRRFRAVVDRHLADERIRPLAPMIRAITEQSASDLTAAAGAQAGRAEVVRDYGRRVAVRVQSRWLGWPSLLEAELVGWIEDNIEATRSGQAVRTAAVAEQFDRIVRGIVQDRREREAAGEQLPDDPTTRLLHDQVEDSAALGGSRPLSQPELISMLRNWTSGDLGSIAASIGVVVHHVARNPGLQAALRTLAQDEDRHTEELDAAVDEMLRIDDPFPSNRRLAVRPAELAGYAVPELTPIAVNWTAANRDERVFGDPDAFRPAENGAANIVYGAGPHVCPGRLLSTLQIRGALTALLRASSSIRLDPDRPAVREPFPSRGFDDVPVLLR